MELAESLLKQARQWDEAALASIYDTYAPALYRYAYRLTGHEETAQDVVSETFHRFLVALKNGGGPEQHLQAWLYRVAHNQIVDLYRRQPAQPSIALDNAPEVATPGKHEEHLEQKEEAGRVRAALQILTPLQQQVILLRFIEEFSNEEIARVVERTVGAVKALQHRALDALRRVLEETDEA